MKIKFTIVVLALGLSLITLACSKSGDGSLASMSDDDKHKLLQAASVSQDHTLFVEVSKKLGLVDSSGKPTPAFSDFMKAQLEWIKNNPSWIVQYAEPQKAKEYVKSHMPQ